MVTGYEASFEPAMREALAEAARAAGLEPARPRPGHAYEAGAARPESARPGHGVADAGAAGPEAEGPGHGHPKEIGVRATAAGTRAGGEADVPVGAVVLDPSGTVIARAHNRREADLDPTAHAEVVALRAAARAVGAWRLDGCTLVVTLEPCTMCAGAASAARIARLVFGATDPKSGAVGSLWDVVRDRRLAHCPEVVGGVLASECGMLLREFFARRRHPGD